MNGLNDTRRRTVLKTIGAGVVGGSALTGTASGHGDDDWGTPAWLLEEVWEMADRAPSGEEPTNDNSHVPIYYIAPGAAPTTDRVRGKAEDDCGDEGTTCCAQITGKEFRKWANLNDSEAEFMSGEWGSVDVDQTLHDVVDDEDTPVTEFSPLWHVHFVFDADAETPYEPADLVNEYNGQTNEYNGPLINSGYRILAAEAAGAVEVVEAPFVFNCPGRPAQGDHLDYCG